MPGSVGAHGHASGFAGLADFKSLSFETSYTAGALYARTMLDYTYKFVRVSLVGALSQTTVSMEPLVYLCLLTAFGGTPRALNKRIGTLANELRLQGPAKGLSARVRLALCEQAGITVGDA